MGRARHSAAGCAWGARCAAARISRVGGGGTGTGSRGRRRGTAGGRTSSPTTFARHRAAMDPVRHMTRIRTGTTTTRPSITAAGPVRLVRRGPVPVPAPARRRTRRNDPRRIEAMNRTGGIPAGAQPAPAHPRGSICGRSPRTTSNPSFLLRAPQPSTRTTGALGIAPCSASRYRS